ncbi:MAG: carbohydrate ABC transporter, N-acetylglucosamine/diacetylchitobiose-binding protein, partial [Propionibacteriaceae bacterium]|nr:carbohydrate ABC transporter, N-acetylglucosamine/diacetylchitobiose-binding protein [Propionibacteriaceae bacterium]
TGGLSACATGGGGNSASQAPAGNQDKSAENPLGVDKKAPLDYVIFNGGYGDEYGAEHVKLYNTWAGGEVAKMTSTVKIGSTLQPRFANGNPPDVLDNSGADAMPTATLVAQNQLADLKPLLDAPTVDDPGTKISDVLLPGAIEAGSYDGTFRQLGYVFSMWGFWYSSKLFKDKGWQPAKDWDGFMALSEKIKATGLAPFIHTGVHTQYMATIIATMAAKHGGKDIVLNIDNLKPNGWTNDSMLAAAKAWEEYAKAGYILKDSVGIDHTTSQTQWLLGKAAMIPVGSWLENEMKGKVPSGFDMMVTPTPALSKDDKLPFETINGGSGEPFIVAEQGKNKLGGMQFLRIMLSKAGASKFAELTGSLAAVKGAGESLTNPSTALKSVADAAAAAGPNLIAFNYASWYAPLNDGQKDPVRALLVGKMSGDQFCSTMQKLSDDVAADPKIKKYTRSSA